MTGKNIGEVRSGNHFLVCSLLLVFFYFSGTISHHTGSHKVSVPSNTVTKDLALIRETHSSTSLEITAPDATPVAVFLDARQFSQHHDFVFENTYNHIKPILASHRYNQYFASGFHPPHFSA
jgi:hypothetical protein